MSKTTIEFEYNGKEYTLEYTAETLKRLEKTGFSFGNLADHLLTAPEDIFYGAFEANHKDTPRKLRQKIWNELSASSGDEDGEGEQLNEVLYEMINEASKSLRPEGNVKWKRGS